MILESFSDWESDLAEKGDYYRSLGEDGQERLNLIADEIALLERIGSDDRMRKPYAELTSMFADDKERIRWIRFVVACQEALDDFSYERWLLDEGQFLKKEILDASDKLYELLMKLEELSGFGYDNHFDESRHEDLNWPLQLFITTAKTKFIVGKDRKGRFENWQRRKLAVPLSKERESLSDDARTLEEGLDSIYTTRRRRQVYIRPADIVREIRKEASDWGPWIGANSGPAEVVLASQKRTRKTRTIRTFWYCLTWWRYSYGVKWTKTAKMMKAVAQVCDVILNDPNDSVSHADVKYALNIFDKKSEKNPPKKRRIRSVD